MNLSLLNDFFYLNINKLEIITNTEEDTHTLGKEFAKYLRDMDILTLTGELGSGKTVFVNGIASFYDLQDEVCSPTFTIVNEYHKDNITINHFDVYKIKSLEEFENTIGMEYFTKGISIIEWGEIIKDLLPKNTIAITIEKIDSITRKFIIKRGVN